MRRHGAEWTDEEKSQVLAEARRGTPIHEVARLLERSERAIDFAARSFLPADDQGLTAECAWGRLREHQDFLQRRHEPIPLRKAVDEQSERVPAVLNPPLNRAQTSVSGNAAPCAPHPPVELAGRGHEGSDLDLLLVEAISSLRKPRLQEILMLRIGLSSSPENLAEIGARERVSRERIRQLQEKALVQLHRGAKSPGSPGARLRETLPFSSEEQHDDDSVLALLQLVDEHFDCDYRVALQILLRASGLGKYSVTKIVASATSLRKRHRQEEAERRRDVATVNRRTARVDGWLESAQWPPRTATPPAFSRLTRLRTPEQGFGHAGKFSSTKLGRDVLYESGLELRVFEALESSTMIAYYQEQPVSIPYSFNGLRRNYYPDLFLATTDGRGVFIEVKPLWQMALSINRAKADAAREFANSRGFGWVSTDGTHTFRELQDRTLSPEARAAIRRLVSVPGGATWPAIRSLRERLPLTLRDVATCAVQEGLAFELMPFRLMGHSGPHS